MDYTIRTRLRRRKQIFYKLIETQRTRLKEGGKHLIWKRKQDKNIKYDVIIIFSAKGFHYMDTLSQILNDYLPQLIIDKKEAHRNKNEEAFYISADNECLKEAANIMKLVTNTDPSRENSVSIDDNEYQCKNDLNSEPSDETPQTMPNENNDSLLTTRQRQTIIKYYLDNLRWYNDKMKINNENKSIKFLNGEAIIIKLLKLGYIKQILPLHNENELNKLRDNWLTKFFSPQPLNDIYEYFGKKISIYYAFLGYYTFALFIPALFGIFITIYNNKLWLHDVCIIIYSIFIIFWSSFYLNCWNEYQSKLNSQWINKESIICLNRVRPQFYGEIIENANTGEVILRYPEWKRKLFQYFITIPIIGASLIIVFFIMFYSLNFQTWWDEVLIEQRGYPLWTSYIPKILFACIINVADALYSYIAIWLNNKENYEHWDTHEDHLIIKLVLFQFVNSFLSLFYIAFYKGDMDKLKEQLAALLITRQVIGNLKESFLPFLTQSYKLSKSLDQRETSQAELESELFRYESTYEDYLELYIQFGYVTLFSTAFPLASFCALINNIIEIRSDAFKLCVTYQRPFDFQSDHNIGVWRKLFNVMVYISIIVNCALIGKSGQLGRILPFEDGVHICLACVILEHLMIFIKIITERSKFSNIIDFLIGFNDVYNYCDTSENIKLE